MSKESRSRFREERLGEPLDRWTRTFERYQQGFERLFAHLGTGPINKLTASRTAALFSTPLTETPEVKKGDPPLSRAEKKIRRERLSDAFRYLAGPPISADDLQVLAEVDSIAASRLQNDAEGASRILATICQALDVRRTPWLVEGRNPTPTELQSAVAASAALLTSQRVSTDRRNEGKAAQEALVHQALIDAGFEFVSPRDIRTIQEGPEQKQFCGESLVGSRKADVIVRLKDTRLLLIECKVSNSSLNSKKRINNDAAVKAVTWTKEFGTNQVVPMAVLSGVFKVSDLVLAQEAGLALIWAHDLSPLVQFIESTGGN